MGGPSNFRTIYFHLFWAVSESEVTVPWTVNRPQKPPHPLSCRSAMRHWHLNCGVIRKHNPPLSEKNRKQIHTWQWFLVWNSWSLLNVNVLSWCFRCLVDWTWEEIIVWPRMWNFSLELFARLKSSVFVTIKETDGLRVTDTDSLTHPLTGQKFSPLACSAANEAITAVSKVVRYFSCWCSSPYIQAKHTEMFWKDLQKWCKSDTLQFSGCSY